MFNLLNIRNSKRGYSISDAEAPSPLIPLRRRGKQYAFTLAEVLITLVIIGVIAAITVPTLITKYQKEQTVTKLKKAYSTISQTTNRAISDNGPLTNWELGHNAQDTVAFFNKYIIPYVHIMKKPITSEEGNWLNSRTLLNNTQSDYDDSYARFYLSDGTSITGYIQFNNSTNKSLAIFIDINGDKKPNKVGKDIFQFYYVIYSESSITNGKLIPTGLAYTREELLSNSEFMCNKNQSGQRCSSLIMKDGWQITDDYPW